MRFTEALSAHVASLTGGGCPSFSVGEWLNGLRDEQISALGSLLERWRAAAGSRVDDDIVGVALIAATAEGRPATVATPAALSHVLLHLTMIVSFESLRRSGLIEIDNLPLTMDPNLKLRFRVTDRGEATALHIAVRDLRT